MYTSSSIAQATRQASSPAIATLKSNPLQSMNAASSPSFSSSSSPICTSQTNRKDFQEYLLNIEDSSHKLLIQLLLNKDLSIDSFLSFPHPLNSSFSIEEDRILILATLRRREGDVSPTGDDIVREYKQRSKLENIPHPKPTATMGVLQQRIAELKTLGIRYHMLYRDVINDIKKIEDEEGEKSKEKEPSKTNIGMRKKKSGGIPSTHHAPFSAFGNTSSLTVEESNTDPMVDIIITARNLQNSTINAKEKDLVSTSEYFKSVLKEESTEDVNLTKKVSFSELDSSFASQDMFGAFSVENFQRFVKFAENPKIQQKFRESVENCESFKRNSYESLERAVTTIHKQKESTLNDMKQNLVKRKDDVEKALISSREKDIAKIKMLYDVHIQGTMKKVEAMIERRKQDIETFFNSEIEKTRKLYEKHEKPTIKYKEEEVAKYETMMNDILPPDDIVPMLILSEILKAEDLRDICVGIISQNFEKYRQKESLGSSLISRDTLKEIVSRLGTEILKDMSCNLDYYLSSNFVNREIEYRKGVIAEEIREYSVDQLLELSEHKPLFPEIVEKEICRRREEKPFVCINRETLSPHLHLEKDHLTNHKRYAALHASHSKSFEGWGKWYFEVHIEKLDSSYGSSISIGWDTPRSSLEGVIPGLTPNNRLHYGYAWQSDGILHYEGKAEYMDEKYNQGDVLGFLIDQDKRLLSFFKNGKTITMRKREVKGEVVELNFLNIKEKLYELIPAACVFLTKKGSSCQIRFNFTGPFKNNDIRFFEPYGDERKLFKQKKQQELKKQEKLQKNSWE